MCARSVAVVLLGPNKALARFLAAQSVIVDGLEVPFFAGLWSIVGDALYSFVDPSRSAHTGLLPLPGTDSGTIATAAVAFAEASRGARAMACLAPIGADALAMLPALRAARAAGLPVLFLLATERTSCTLDSPAVRGIGGASDPDAVLAPFRSLSRYYARVPEPAALLTALPRALATLIDPASAGPVTLVLDAPREHDSSSYPEEFFAEHLWRSVPPAPAPAELARAVALLGAGTAPLLVVGRGATLSNAGSMLFRFVSAHAVPFAETRGGKGLIASTHPLNLGAIGEGGTDPANALAAEADVILAVGTTLASTLARAPRIFARPGRRILSLSLDPEPARANSTERAVIPLVADAHAGILALDMALRGWRAPELWAKRARSGARAWRDRVAMRTAASDRAIPGAAETLGALARVAGDDALVVAAAESPIGALLCQVWQVLVPHGLVVTHAAPGLEIAAGLGTKCACPTASVFVVLDAAGYRAGSAAIAATRALDRKLVLVVFDEPASHPAFDIAKDAVSLSLRAHRASRIAEFIARLREARAAAHTSLVAIACDPPALLPPIAVSAR